MRPGADRRRAPRSLARWAWPADADHWTLTGRDGELVGLDDRDEMFATLRGRVRTALGDDLEDEG